MIYFMNTNIGEQEKTEQKIILKKSKGDILLAVISVLIAILLWFWVVGFESQVTKKKFASVQVNIDNFSDMKTNYNYSIINERDLYIDVTLEGKSSDLNRVKQIYAYVDLKEVTQPGEISLPIKIKDMDYVQVAEISQSNMLLYVDKETFKPLPVDARIVQMVTEENVNTGILNVTPNVVTVYGPETVLKNLDHALVNISLGSSPINRPVTVTEKFILIDKDGKEVKNQYINTREVTAIDVYIPVTSTKEVPVAVNYKYGYYNDKNAKITVTPDKIKIVGSPDYIQNINSVSLKDIIDERKYEGDATVTNSVLLPNGVSSLSGETVQIDINFINPGTKLLNIYTSKQNTNFNIVPPKNSEYHIKEDRVEIKILGPSENLKKINSSNIYVNVDLSSYEKGTYSNVPLDISVTSDDSAFCVGEYFITVEIY